MTFFPAVLVLVDRRHADRAARTAPRAHQLEHIQVPRARGRSPHSRAPCSPPRGSSPPRPSAALPGVRLRLQPAQPPGQGHGVGGLGAAHPRHSGPLGLQRRWPPPTRWRSSAGSRPPSSGSPRCPRWTRCCASSPTTQEEKIEIIDELRAARGPRPGEPARRPVDLDRLTQAAARPQAPVRHRGRARRPPCRPRSASCVEQRGRASEAAANGDREVAEPALTHLQAQLYRDFVDKFHALQRNLTPRPVEPRRHPRRDAPEVHRRERPVPASSSIPRVDIWERAGARAVRAGAAHGRSRRHGIADHHLRGDPPHGAGVHAGHPLRVRAGGRPDVLDAPARAGDACSP